MCRVHQWNVRRMIGTSNEPNLHSRSSCSSHQLAFFRTWSFAFPEKWRNWWPLICRDGCHSAVHYLLIEDDIKAINNEHLTVTVKYWLATAGKGRGGLAGKVRIVAKSRHVRTWHSEGEYIAVLPLGWQLAESASPIEEHIHQLVTFYGLIKGHDNFSICLQQANSISSLLWLLSFAPLRGQFNCTLVGGAYWRPSVHTTMPCRTVGLGQTFASGY